jgi:hypothetical protein
MLFRSLREFDLRSKNYVILIVRTLSCLPNDTRIEEIKRTVKDKEINLVIIVLDNMEKTDMMDLDEMRDLIASNPVTEGNFYNIKLQNLSEVFEQLKLKISN